MRIATWNVNSIKQRLDNVLAWLKEREPDVACLQETKCIDKAFPREAIEALGYNVTVHGQKTFNGVAVVSKSRFDEVTARLPGDDEDDHARFLEVVVTSGAPAVPIPPTYLPNGDPRCRGQLYVLGLPSRRLAEECRHPHRPFAAVAAGRRPLDGGRHRQARPRLGKTGRPRARLDRTGFVRSG